MNQITYHHHPQQKRITYYTTPTNHLPPIRPPPKKGSLKLGSTKHQRHRTCKRHQVVDTANFLVATIKSFNPSVSNALPKCSPKQSHLFFSSQDHCVVCESALPQKSCGVNPILKVQGILWNLPISTDPFIPRFNDPWIVQSVYDFVIRSG